jgi:hypothetical protein
MSAPTKFGLNTHRNAAEPAGFLGFFTADVGRFYKAGRSSSTAISFAWQNDGNYNTRDDALVTPGITAQQTKLGRPFSSITSACMTCTNSLGNRVCLEPASTEVS